jgi:glycosyltransferase involved in cell wall biosynthesis
MNEKLGSWLGNHLIADHPEIKKHLAQFVPSDKITVIPYSADLLRSADINQLDQFGLKPGKYAILIARPEPENSILEIVRAYSSQKRGMRLVVLGNYNPNSDEYQKTVLDVASDETMFVGAIYRQAQVQALRFFARFYIHGHTVGGTNPSLVEALGAGSPVLAHDNKFNRWVAGEDSFYFSTETECEKKISELIKNDEIISSMKAASLKQYIKKFTADKVHSAYEQLLKEHGF